MKSGLNITRYNLTGNVCNGLFRCRKVPGQPLQLSPKWRCNILQKHSATFWKNSLQKTHSKDTPNKIILPKNDYVCIMHKGKSQNRVPYLKRIIAYINSNGYELIGDVIQLSLVDDTVSDNFDEYIFDIQAPVKKI